MASAPDKTKIIPTLRYPSAQFYADDQPFIIFTPRAYELPLSQLFSVKIEPKPAVNKKTEAVLLFMPGNFSESIGSEWSAQAVVGGAGNNFGQMVFGNALKALDQLGGASEIIGKSALGYAGKSALPTDVFLFNSAKAPTFSLSFNFLPFNTEEAIAVSKICKNFKQASLPLLQDGKDIMLNWPDVWDLTFHHIEGIGIENSSYEMMALISADVRYNSGATNMLTYTNGTALETTLTLTFQATRKSFIGAAGLKKAPEADTAELADAKNRAYEDPWYAQDAAQNEKPTKVPQAGVPTAGITQTPGT